MPGPTETFHLPTGWRLAFALTQVAPPFGAAAVRLWAYLSSRGLPQPLPAPAVLSIVGLIAMGIVPYTVTLLISRVTVGADGIVFNRLFDIRWGDVVAARERKVLKVSHLYLERRKGMPIWLPLYYRGRRPIRDVLRDYAPEGHPIRICLTA
jgi:hypothetical protein